MRRSLSCHALSPQFRTVMTTRALTALALSASLTAQSFAYTDFSTVTSLNLLGSAAQSGTALRLTALHRIAPLQ